MTDRSRYLVRKLRLEDKYARNDYSQFTADERLAMVMFKEGMVEEPPMRRDVVRVVRRHRDEP